MSGAIVGTWTITAVECEGPGVRWTAKFRPASGMSKPHPKVDGKKTRLGTYESAIQEARAFAHSCDVGRARVGKTKVIEA